MAKDSYPGGHSIENKGAHGDPGGRGTGSRSGPSLKGSQRMPDPVLARKIPYARKTLELVVELSDSGQLRVHNIVQIRKWLSILDSFKREISSQHRLAYDESFRLIEEIQPHMKRQLGQRDAALAKLHRLTKVAR